MAEKHILHMLSPLSHVSPFDVNMALDAGFDAVVPYDGVKADDVTGLVQDAMFSRPPDRGVRTSVFIGGRDAVAALDMLQAAERAMVPPFAISRFADPAGSFTTAAAMVACVERKLKQQDGRALRGVRVVVLGATGVVGFASGVIAALEGAAVTLAGHDGATRVGRSAEEISRRFGVTVHTADASTAALKKSALHAAEVALCGGRAGTQILSKADLQAAPNLRVVADVNAVPPLGVEGLEVMADGAPVGSAGAVGIGALAIGQIKYRNEFGMFRRMIEAEKPVALDFRDAFALARDLVA
jgi:methylene-tetrahydromethanopterin dehydrogenase